MPLHAILVERYSYNRGGREGAIEPYGFKRHETDDRSLFARVRT